MDSAYLRIGGKALLNQRRSERKIFEVNTTPKRGGMTGGLEGRKRSQRLKDAGFHFVQAPVV